MKMKPLDLSSIDFNFIELFSFHYSGALTNFPINPMEASPKMQKKIRRYLEQSIKGESFPETIEKRINASLSDEEYLSFFKACHDKVQEEGTYQSQLFERNAADLSEEAREALRDLIFRQFCSGFHKRGQDACLFLAFGGSYDRVLVLKNATCLPENDYHSLSFGTPPLIRDEEGFRLVGIGEDWDAGTESPFAVGFTDAEVEFHCFRADDGGFHNNPWHHLLTLASEILEKCHLPEPPLNALEKEHLPLIAELGKLSYWARIPEQYQRSGFPLLKEACERFDFQRPLALLERLENRMAAGQDPDRIIHRLLSLLNRQKYEPLWRELYGLLQKTQEGYPSRKEQAPEVIIEARKIVEEQLNILGFEGQYPDFIKIGAFPTPRLAESYGLTYFAGPHRHAAFHIHCAEEIISDGFFLEFLCGTEFLRKGEAPKDIYSCRFDAEGRRFSQSFSYQYEDKDADPAKRKEKLSLYAQVAAKRAELLRLTKAERKEIFGLDRDLLLFFLIFILMGGGFGIFMTLGFMLISLLSALIVGQPQAIPEIFAATPWWAILLFCWVGFGSTMGILTALAKRK